MFKNKLKVHFKSIFTKFAKDKIGQTFRVDQPFLSDITNFFHFASQSANDMKIFIVLCESPLKI